MPYLDVTELLQDPELAESFSVTQRPQVLVAGRVTVPNPITVPGVIGVVMALPADELDRLDDHEKLSRHFMIVTKFRLRGPSKDAAGQKYQPDLITWRGDQYIVSKVSTFPEWGPGFFQVTVKSIDLTDQVLV
jgi:hypothetical protein